MGGMYSPEVSLCTDVGGDTVVTPSNSDINIIVVTAIL